MRDEKRIQRILELIGKVWKKYPDLRLTQLILDCFDTTDVYYIEDDELEEKLKWYYGKS